MSLLMSPIFFQILLSEQGYLIDTVWVRLNAIFFERNETKEPHETYRKVISSEPTPLSMASELAL